MLADAAVVGKVFWAGAVAQMGGRDREGVTRRSENFPARNSASGAAFLDRGRDRVRLLAHPGPDVAYAQLPRASRASRHVAAAGGSSPKTPERVEDLADMLAHHYTPRWSSPVRRRTSRRPPNWRRPRCASSRSPVNAR